MKYETTVTAVGNLAQSFLDNSHSIILLDEGVRPNLSEMVVEHATASLVDDIVPGDILTMGAKRKYKVISVGDKANENLRKEGHATIVVNAEGSMPGQIIVKGDFTPRLRVGDPITFEAPKEKGNKEK